MGGVEIKRILPADVSAITHISHLAFAHALEKYQFCPAATVTEAQVEEFLKQADGYKILKEGQLVGGVFIMQEKDHNLLDTVIVHPDRQNQGIGAVAIRMAEAQYDSSTSWVLQTPEQEKRNIHLYTKLGYVTTDREKINDALTLVTMKKWRLL